MAGLYIHIPFCLKKCKYCDFVSFEKWNINAKEDYKNAIIKEIRSIKGQSLDTVFIGGGTPTSLPHTMLAEILEVLFEIGVNSNSEITVEANPETITDEYAVALKKMGVNRVSMGLQSGEDAVLKAIGRVHSYDRFVSAFTSLRNADFDNINVDLMYGLPGQTKELFEDTIHKVIALDPEHISAYSLIVNDDTPLAKEIDSGKTILPDAIDIETGLKLFEGKYQRYEVSNYCKKGKECRHNINYWQNGFYYGVGCGAHGCLSKDMARGMGYGDFDCESIRTEHTSNLAEYIKGDIPLFTPISRSEAMFETVMVGLRMVQGIDELAFEERYHCKLYDIIKDYVDSHSQLILRKDGYIRLSNRGMDIQNSVLVDLMDYFE